MGSISDSRPEGIGRGRGLIQLPGALSVCHLSDGTARCGRHGLILAGQSSPGISPRPYEVGEHLETPMSRGFAADRRRKYSLVFRWSGFGWDPVPVSSALGGHTTRDRPTPLARRFPLHRRGVCVRGSDCDSQCCVVMESMGESARREGVNANVFDGVAWNEPRVSEGASRGRGNAARVGGPLGIVSALLACHG